MAGSIPLRLQDTKQAAWADGKRDIFLVIYKQPGAELRELVNHDPVRPRVVSEAKLDRGERAHTSTADSGSCCSR